MNERILIIDDETNIRTMMRLALEASGYKVDAAADGREGLEKFGDGDTYDLVILDQRMPGLSGLEVQAEMYRRTPTVRLVVVTAFGTIDTALDAIQSGASDFLRKPFTADTLRSSVRTVLDRPARECRVAAPGGTVCRQFTRKTINGFAFEHVGDDHGAGNYITYFEVANNLGKADQVKVIIPTYVQELARAYADTEEMPGGERFWLAMAEEGLANYLWQQAELPSGNELLIDDITPGLQSWLKSMTTVNV